MVPEMMIEVCLAVLGNSELAQLDLNWENLACLRKEVEFVQKHQYYWPTDRILQFARLRWSRQLSKRVLSLQVQPVGM